MGSAGSAGSTGSRGSAFVDPQSSNTQHCHIGPKKYEWIEGHYFILNLAQSINFLCFGGLSRFGNKKIEQSE